MENSYENQAKINNINITNNQFSFENDYKRFHSEMDREKKIAKKIKKIMFKSKQNIRERIWTGEIIIGSKESNSESDYNSFIEEKKKKIIESIINLNPNLTQNTNLFAGDKDKSLINQINLQNLQSNISAIKPNKNTTEAEIYSKLNNINLSQNKRIKFEDSNVNIINKKITIKNNNINDNHFENKDANIGALRTENDLENKEFVKNLLKEKKLKSTNDKKKQIVIN